MMYVHQYDVLKYMIIHLLLFLVKNVFSKLLVKLSFNYDSKGDESEIEIMKKNLESLKDKKREISPQDEYVKYTKIERQIDNLSDEIKRKETEMNLKNFNNNYLNPQEMNLFQKIINSSLNTYLFQFFMYFINIIEYIILKNEYLEVDYESNKNNIVANYYYNESDNKYYSLIPVYRILISETIVLNSLYNLIQKLIS